MHFYGKRGGFFPTASCVSKHPSKIIIALIFLFTTFGGATAAGAVGRESALQKKRDMIKKFLQVSPSSGEMMH